MKFYPSKLGFCAVAAFGLALATAFSSCSDSNTTEVVESNGMDTLAKGEKLPDCTKDNAGNMLYVTDSTAVFYCADGKWTTLNGKDGEKGKEGTSTEGTPGTSCTAKTVKEGIEISCDGKVIGTVKNGEAGTATDGMDGAGCKIDEGKGNGIVEVTCGEGKNAKTVTLYKAICSGENYDPVEKVCFEGVLYNMADGYNATNKMLLDIRDNQLYKTVTIEGSYDLVVDEQTQEKTTIQYKETWMAQNLNYAYTGIPFKLVIDNDTYESDSTSWCGGGESGTTKEGDCTKYGRLYTWAAAIDSVALASDADNPQTCGYGKECDRLKATALAANPIQGVCPKGWHLPSNADWGALSRAIGERSTRGTKLKSTSGWADDGNGEDSFDFTILPAGYRDFHGKFYDVGKLASFWVSTEDDKKTAWRLELAYNKTNIAFSYSLKTFGHSVRCLKD